MEESRKAITPISYKGFTPLENKFYVNDPLESDPLARRRVPITLYKPILVDDGAFHPERVFCCLGPKYDNVYMELDMVIARLFRNYRKDDWESYTKKQDPRITVWQQNGKVCSRVPPTIFEYTINTDFEAWDKKQAAIWKNIVSASAEQASKVPSDHGYFIEPNDKISLWFTPAPSNLITKEQLEHMFEHAFEDEKHKHDVQFLTFEEARTNDDLVLVGNNPFHLYYMWMDSKEYKKLWQDNGVPGFQHSWPKDKPALSAIDRKIDAGNVPDEGCQEQLVHVSREKYLLAETLGEQPGSEQYVMGGLSAAEVAKALWAKSKSEGDKTDDLEWISRVHFCLGGLASGVASKEDANADPASRLAKANIILGSRGCKAHMTRTENAIINSLEAEASSSPLGLRPGLIWTRDNHQKGAEVRRFGTDGDRDLHHIPDWVATGQYPWLSVELQYFTTMAYRSLGDVTLCSFESFDPLSRYAPTLVEAKLDRYLASHLKDYSHSITSYHSSDHANAYRSSGDELATGKLWEDVHSRKETVKVGNIVVTEPRIVGDLASSPECGKPLSAEKSCPPVPSEGFIVAGTIHLFGSARIKAHLHKWQGPPPSHVELKDEPLKVESAHIDEDFHLSSVMSGLKGTQFEKITFRNARFYHQNYQFDQSRSVGWHFDADLVVDQNCGGLHELLTKALGATTKTTVPVRAALGLVGEWKSTFNPHSFMLYGLLPSVPNTVAQPVQGLHLNQIGVRLMAIRKLNFSPAPQSVLTYGFGVYGTMRLEVPDSPLPLNLEYEMRESNGNVQIGATIAGNTWYNPFGINGTLQNVNFAADFPLKAPWKDFSFDVSAMFAYHLTYATFAGSYNPAKKDFILSSYFPNFAIENIAQLFHHVTRDYIRVPDVNIKIGAASVYLSSSKGISATLHDFEIAGFRIKKAEVDFYSGSVLIKGKLNDNPISFEDVQLHDPVLHIYMEGQCSVATMRRTDPVIRGRVELESRLSFPAAAYLYPACNGSDVEWTVMGSLTKSHSEVLALSKIVPELAGSSLDLALNDVLYVAASKDDPEVGQMISHYQPFRRGVQICAAIGEIPILNKVVRHHVHGLKLRAEWSKAAGYNLAVITHKYLSHLDLGKGLETTSIQLAIQTRPPQLVISSNLNVPVPNSVPLVFQFNLIANDIGVSIKGETNESWDNPMKVGTNVKIGPTLKLALDVKFENYPGTLVPCITGGLQVGNTPITVTLNYSQNLERQYISGESSKLCKADLVSFAKQVTNTAIKDIPEEFSDLSSVKLYIRPGGLQVPQGFSLTAAATFCGKQTDLLACIEKERRQITVNGSIKNLELAHLKIQGERKPDPVIRATVSNSKQETTLNGKTKIYDDERPVQAELNSAGKPNFRFHSLLIPSSMHRFTLNADYLGAFPLKNLEDAEFNLRAELTSVSRDQMRKDIVSKFRYAKECADTMRDADQSKLKKLEGDIARDLGNAIQNLDNAMAAYQEKEKELTEKEKELEKERYEQMEELQEAQKQAEAKYNKAVTKTQGEYDEAVNESKKTQEEDAKALDAAQRNMLQKVGEAQTAYDNALKAFDCKFKSMPKELENARAEQARLQKKLEEVQRKIKNVSHCDRAARECLESQEKAIKREIDCISADIRNAEARPDYKAAQELRDSSKQNLEETKKACEEAVKKIIERNNNHRDTAQKKIAAKQDARDKAKVNTGDKDKAQKALEDFRCAMEAKFNDIKTSRGALANTDEWRAVLAAGQEVSKQQQQQDLYKAELVRVAQDKAKQQRIGELCQYVVKGPFEICQVHLEGKSKEIIDKTGTFVKPLGAKVECNVNGQSYPLDPLVFHPSQVDTFIQSVYDQLYKKLDQANVQC